jgi:hypothetical protein
MAGGLRWKNITITPILVRGSNLGLKRFRQLLSPRAFDSLTRIASSRISASSSCNRYNSQSPPPTKSLPGPMDHLNQPCCEAVPKKRPPLSLHHGARASGVIQVAILTQLREQILGRPGSQVVVSKRWSLVGIELQILPRNPIRPLTQSRAAPMRPVLREFPGRQSLL